MDVKFKKEKSQKLKEILNRGNKINSITQNWLRQHKDYNGSESIIDGSIISILARGNIDGRLNESIVEIKSINKLPESTEEIIQNYNLVVRIFRCHDVNFNSRKLTKSLI